jgi:hypothetical protein
MATKFLSSELLRRVVRHLYRLYGRTKDFLLQGVRVTSKETAILFNMTYHKLVNFIEGSSADIPV